MTPAVGPPAWTQPSRTCSRASSALPTPISRKSPTTSPVTPSRSAADPSPPPPTKGSTMLRKNKIRLGVVAAVVAIPLTMASSSSGQSATQKDQATVAHQLSRYQANQPVPQFDRSQYRQTLIDVESAEVHGTATTTFFFQQGLQAPVMSCPSVGYPLASTAQLTNPDQMHHYNGNPYTIPQQETNGVYTGDSSGTYVACVQPGGVRQIDYWEGFVYTTGGPAHWNGTQVVTDGKSTVTTGK